MTLMEDHIDRETGIRNEAEIKRKAQTLANRDKDSKSKGYGGLTDLQKAIQRLTQRTVKFIRWLKIIWMPSAPGTKPWPVSPRSMPPHEGNFGHRCLSRWGGGDGGGIQRGLDFPGVELDFAGRSKQSFDYLCLS